MNDFDDLMAHIEAEAQAEGPETVVELRAFDELFKRAQVGPVGRRAVDAAAGRGGRIGAYLEARRKYEAIRQLRKTDPAAAGERESRYEEGEA
jgi:hypothetical protein